jgi:hypothetical protein
MGVVEHRAVPQSPRSTGRQRVGTPRKEPRKGSDLALAVPSLSHLRVRPVEAEHYPTILFERFADDSAPRRREAEARI